MRGWGTPGPAWVAVVIDGYHLGRERRQDMTVGGTGQLVQPSEAAITKVLQT